MPTLLPELIIAPLLVGAATLAARRWGSRVAGLVSAFPAVVGPVLLIVAQERGTQFAARAANGTLLGLVALSGFVLVYARVAVRARWGSSLLAGWVCAVACGALVAWLVPGHGLLTGLVLASGSLALAYLAMPDVHAASAGATARGDDLVLRMALTALLVASLAATALLVGPLIGGMLTALPVLASVLAVFTHRRAGPDALVALLRGMVVGMSGFVGFCAVVALLIVPLGIGPAFAVATLTALGLQVLGLEWRARPLAV